MAPIVARNNVESTTQEDPTGNGIETTGLIIIIGAGAVILVIAAVVLLVYCRKRRRSSNSTDIAELSDGDAGKEEKEKHKKKKHKDKKKKKKKDKKEDDEKQHFMFSPLKRKCRARYSYLGPSSTHLALKTGDIVTVVEEDNYGLCRGVIGDREGWFPINYVEEYREPETYTNEAFQDDETGMVIRTGEELPIAEYDEVQVTTFKEDQDPETAEEKEEKTESDHTKGTTASENVKTTVVVVHAQIESKAASSPGKVDVSANDDSELKSANQKAEENAADKYVEEVKGSVERADEEEGKDDDSVRERSSSVKKKVRKQIRFCETVAEIPRNSMTEDDHSAKTDVTSERAKNEIDKVESEGHRDIVPDGTEDDLNGGKSLSKNNEQNVTMTAIVMHDTEKKEKEVKPAIGPETAEKKTHGQSESAHHAKVNEVEGGGNRSLDQTVPSPKTVVVVKQTPEVAKVMPKPAAPSKATDSTMKQEVTSVQKSVQHETPPVPIHVSVKPETTAVQKSVQHETTSVQKSRTQHAGVKQSHKHEPAQEKFSDHLKELAALLKKERIRADLDQDTDDETEGDPTEEHENETTPVSISTSPNQYEDNLMRSAGNKKRKAPAPPPPALTAAITKETVAGKQETDIKDKPPIQTEEPVSLAPATVHKETVARKQTSEASDETVVQKKEPVSSSALTVNKKAVARKQETEAIYEVYIQNDEPVAQPVSFAKPAWTEQAKRTGTRGYENVPPHSSYVQQKTYRAIYNFSGKGGGELSVEVNDLLIVLERDPLGWVKGRLEKNGETGWLPEAYIEEWMWEQVEDKICEGFYHNDFEEEGVEYKAIHSYRGNSDIELTFNVGESIFVLEECDNGWWRGIHDNVQGWFPGSHVELCENSDGLSDATSFESDWFFTPQSTPSELRPENFQWDGVIPSIDANKGNYGGFEIIPQLYEAMKARAVGTPKAKPKRRAPQPPVDQTRARPISADQMSLQSFSSESQVTPRQPVPRPNNAAIRLVERQHANVQLKESEMQTDAHVGVDSETPTPGQQQQKPHSRPKFVKIPTKAVRRGAASRYHEAPSRPTPPPPEAIQKYQKSHLDKHEEETLGRNQNEADASGQSRDEQAAYKRSKPKPKPRKRTLEGGDLTLPSSSANTSASSDRSHIYSLIDENEHSYPMVTSTPKGKTSNYENWLELTDTKPYHLPGQNQYHGSSMSNRNNTTGSTGNLYEDHSAGNSRSATLPPQPLPRQSRIYDTDEDWPAPPPPSVDDSNFFHRGDEPRRRSGTWSNWDVSHDRHGTSPPVPQPRSAQRAASLESLRTSYEQSYSQHRSPVGLSPSGDMPEKPKPRPRFQSPPPYPEKKSKPKTPVPAPRPDNLKLVQSPVLFHQSRSKSSTPRSNSPVDLAVFSERTAGDGAEMDDYVNVHQIHLDLGGDDQDSENDYDDVGVVLAKSQGGATVFHVESPMTPPSKMRNAIFPYHAQADDELSFRVGQSLIEIEKYEGTGWSRGMLDDGTVGLFPSNYVHHVTEL